MAKMEELPNEPNDYVRIDPSDLLPYLFVASISANAQIAVMRSALSKHGIELNGDEFAADCKSEMQKQLTDLAEESTPLGALARRTLKGLK